MNQNHIYINTTKYLFLLGSILGTLMKLQSSSYPYFILLSLLVIINSQLRTLYFRNKLFIFSIIAETFIVYYFNNTFGNYIYLILFSTLIDSCAAQGVEYYSLSIFTGVTFIYMIGRIFSMELVFIFAGFFITTFLFLLQIRKEFSMRLDSESLYDQIRKSNYELEAARTRLLDYSKQVEMITQLEERNRISRELHDSIGHNLVGILMQLDAAIQVTEVNSSKGMDILKSAYANVNSSIENVRQTVRQLRPVSYQSNINAIEELIYKFKRDTSIEVDFKTTGTPCRLLPSIHTVLYRNIQEALTNSIKHGHCTHINITIFYESHGIRLAISDNGPGAESIKKGFGLTGMEERVHLVGGTISFDGSKGFAINIFIPSEEV